MMRTLWQRLFRSTPARPKADVPQAFHAKLVATKEAGEILSEWQALLQSQPQCFAPALQMAKAAGWPAHECLKLEAYGHLYRGELDEAFALAKPAGVTFDRQRFDVAMFLLAITCLFHRGQYDEALRVMREISAAHGAILLPRADYWQSRAAIEIRLGLLDEAWQSLEEARRRAPDAADLTMAVYSLAFELDKRAEFTALEQEIARLPTSACNALALAAPHLARHDYRRGFQLLEGRYAQADAQFHVNPALPRDRRFRGQAQDYPPGQSLLISCEQGFGDTLMMARYWPALEELTGGHLAIEVQRELLPLLAANFPKIRFVERAMGQRPDVSFDGWLGSMSLPYFFASEAHNVPMTAGYLRATDEALGYWRRRLAELAPSAVRIGIAWSGNPRHLNDRRRSIPWTLLQPHLLHAVASGLTFFTLQTTGLPASLPLGVHDVSEELLSFADTAGLIAALDLIISVDTSVVHLAGALGKMCWLLLPYRYEWRWGLEGERNAWYDAVTVLRQRTHGDWQTLLDEVFTSRLPAWRESFGGVPIAKARSQ